MKLALLLSNHYRSFNYIYKYIRDFWGSDVDIFIATWDHNYAYFSTQELEKHSKELGFDRHHDQRLLTSNRAYQPLNNETILEGCKKIKPKSVSIHSNEDFFDWAAQIKNTGDFTPEQLLHKFGQIFIGQKALELCNNTGNNYDAIIRSRMDNVPWLPEGWSLGDELSRFSKYVNKSPDKKILMIDKLRMEYGFPFMGDKFFYGTQEAMTSFYSNAQTKFNNIQTSGMYSTDVLKQKYYTHKVFGSLLLESGISTNFMKIRDCVIRKDHVDSQMNLYSTEAINTFNREYEKQRFWL